MTQLHRRPRGFTLLELLVVVTVLAVLAALLVPALSRTSSGHRRVTCRSNLNYVGRGVILYANDYRGMYVPFSDESPVVDTSSGTSVPVDQPAQRYWHHILMEGEHVPYESTGGKPFLCPARSTATLGFGYARHFLFFDRSTDRACRLPKGRGPHQKKVKISHKTLILADNGQYTATMVPTKTYPNSVGRDGTPATWVFNATGPLTLDGAPDVAPSYTETSLAIIAVKGEPPSEPVASLHWTDSRIPEGRHQDGSCSVLFISGTVKGWTEEQLDGSFPHLWALSKSTEQFR